MNFRSISALAVSTRHRMPARAIGVVVLAVLTVLTVSACSSSGGQAEPVPLIDDQLGSEPEPQVLRMLRQDAELIAPVPEVVHTQTMAETGLQISYTQESLRAQAPAAVIEKQWVFMQSCVEQLNVAPLVLVREGPADPFTQADDVVRNESALSLDIDSVPIASASTLYGPVLQISVADFDGSLGAAGFNLRSIMGRHLWLSANLPERDYPFECAREQP